MAVQGKTKELDSKLKSYTRTQKDLKRITVYTDYPGVAGWVVKIDYKDNKHAVFTVDQIKGGDMVEVTLDAVKKQMASKQHVTVD